MPEISELSPQKLIDDYSDLVKKIALKYSKYGVAFEDLFQEGIIGLIEAQKRFLPDKEASFSTYAAFWIKNKILALLDKELKNSKHLSLDNDSSFFEPYVNDNLQEDKSSQPLSLKEPIPSDEELVLRKSFEEKKSLSQIAEELNISREKARQLKQKAMRRFKKQVLNDN